MENTFSKDMGQYTTKEASSVARFEIWMRDSEFTYQAVLEVLEHKVQRC